MATSLLRFGLFVVGVDGSGESLHAHRIALELAGRCGAAVTPVKAGEADGVPPDVRVVPGLPGIELPRFAESVNADLLILGRRPRDGFGPPLGATGDAVVRRSRVPCLLLPRHVPGLRRILLALDPGPRGSSVLGFVTEFARAVGADLSCVSVRRRLDFGRHRPPWVEPGDAPCDPSGRNPRRWREGELSTEILAEAAEVGADAVAFGVHRGESLGGAEQEGVSHHLVREARTALLTVPL